MVGICATLAWVGANDLDKFVALVGSFACIPLVYIYPVSLPLLHTIPSRQHVGEASLTRSIAHASLPRRGADDYRTYSGCHGRRPWLSRHGVYNCVDNQQLGEWGQFKGAGLLRQSDAMITSFYRCVERRTDDGRHPWTPCPF